jgi:hypothetical protein
MATDSAQHRVLLSARPNSSSTSRSRASATSVTRRRRPATSPTSTAGADQHERNDVDLAENLLPDATVWRSPEKRCYQSMLASGSIPGHRRTGG